MRTNPEAPLQRVPQTAESLDLRRRSLSLMRDVTIRPELRSAMDHAGLRERRNQWLRTDGRRGLEILAQELIDLQRAGATRAEAEVMLGFVREILEDLYADEPADLLAAELAEIEADLDEDRLQQQAHLVGETDQGRLERARVLRRQGAASFAVARALEDDVRRRELGLYSRRIA